MADDCEHPILIEEVVQQADTAVEQPDNVVEQAATVTTHNVVEQAATENDQQAEAEIKKLEKTAKQLGCVSLGIAVAIIVAYIANKKHSKSRRELMLLRTSAAFALVSFFAWAVLLIIIQIKHLGKIFLRASVVMGIFFIAASVLLLGLNIVV